MTSSEYLDCELYLTGFDQARLSLDGRHYSGRPRLDSSVLQELLGATLEPERYGTLLFEALFPAEHDALREGYLEGLAIARHEKQRLRFRLHIATTAPRELHDLHWELLYDPRHKIAIGRSRETAFSRCLSVAAEPLPVLASRPRLLVILATPQDLAGFDLPDLGQKDLKRSIHAALKPLEERISYEIMEPPATAGNLRERLLADEFHALHLLAHGLVHPTESTAHLVLEDEERHANFIAADLFSEVFEGNNQLRLVTLSACHSGAQPGADPFSGLGPALVERGVPAVIAMREAISLPATTLFTRHFYQHLAISGQVDRAANEARLQMHLSAPESLEWGTPALFMRPTGHRSWQAANDRTLDSNRHRRRPQAAPPRQRPMVSWSTPVVAVLAGLLLLILFARFAPSPLRPKAPESIALLGFEDPEGRSEWNWLTTALSELIAFQLGTIDGLRVLSPREVDELTSEIQLSTNPDLTPDIRTEVLAQARQATDTEATAHGTFRVLPHADGSRISVALWLYESHRRGLRHVEESAPIQDLPELVAEVTRQAANELGISTPRLRKPVRDLPESSDAEATRLYEKGIADLRLLKSAEAREAFEQAIARESKNPYLYAALADAQQELGYEKEAQKSAALALQLSHGLTSVRQFFFLGLDLQKRRERKRAAAVFKALWIAAGTSSTDPESRLDEGLRLARLQAASGFAAEARTTIRSLSIMTEDDPRPWLTRAEVEKSAKQYTEQKTAATRAASTAERQRAALLVARARYLEGEALRNLREHDAALAVFEQVREVYLKEKNAFEVGNVSARIGDIYYTQENWAKAKASFDIAARQYALIGNARHEGKMLSNKAIIHHVQGLLTPAIDVYRAALKQHQDAGDTTAEIYTRTGLTLCQLQMGLLEQAEREHESARRLDEAHGGRNRAYLLRVLGELRRTQGKLAEAQRQLTRALEAYREAEIARSEAVVSVEMAMVQLHQGELDEAQSRIETALETFERSEKGLEWARALKILGDILSYRGELSAAKSHYQEALLLQDSLPNGMFAAETRSSLARLLLAEGLSAEAVNEARQSVAEFKHSKSQLEEARARSILASALLAAGQTADAEEEVQTARHLVTVSESQLYRLPVEFAEAKILQMIGNLEASRELLEQILAETTSGRFVMLELEAKLALGELALDSGLDAAGTALLNEVRQEAKMKEITLIAKLAARAADRASP